MSAVRKASHRKSGFKINRKQLPFENIMIIPPSAPPSQEVVLTAMPLSPPSFSSSTAPPSMIRVQQQENPDGPDHKYQINEQLLYEREFHGHAYVSAHLQRLQHGVYATERMHAKIPMHVTFVAITFVFHPSVSTAHRFQSTVIEITATSKLQGQLRFIKFAPRLAYGRISSECLKWTFQLGATIGVTKGPVNVAINPTQGYEKDRIQGAMLKIQGSTRSANIGGHPSLKKRSPDTKLVWSLEENEQQETGLPREFTFVFLVERVTRTFAMSKTDGKPLTAHTTLGQMNDEKILHAHNDALAFVDHSNTFCPMTIGICVKPVVTGIINALRIDDEPDETTVESEVGQTLPTGGHTHRNDSWNSRVEDQGGILEGYYNFASMPGNFEDLIELPGNSVTTMEPTLPLPGSKNP